MRTSSADKFIEDDKVQWTSVSGLVFLRFFVPALREPRKFGLIKRTPSPNSERNFIIVAQILQKLSNIKSFDIDSLYWNKLDNWLRMNLHNMQEFLDKISAKKIPSRPIVEFPPPKIDAPACSAYLSKLLLKYKKIFEASDHKNAKALVTELEKLEKLTDDLVLQSNKRLGIEPNDAVTSKPSSPIQPPRSVSIGASGGAKVTVTTRSDPGLRASSEIKPVSVASTLAPKSESAPALDKSSDKTVEPKADAVKSDAPKLESVSNPNVLTPQTDTKHRERSSSTSSAPQTRENRSNSSASDKEEKKIKKKEKEEQKLKEKEELKKEKEEKKSRKGNKEKEDKDKKK
jgi:hypothetical protein